MYIPMIDTLVGMVDIETIILLLKNCLKPWNTRKRKPKSPFLKTPINLFPLPWVK